MVQDIDWSAGVEVSNVLSDLFVDVFIMVTCCSSLMAQPLPTCCGAVGRGSAGRRDRPRAGAGLLGLSRASRRAHGGGRGPAPLAGEVGGGMWREGRLSLVTGASLFPLATAAAGRAGGADG